MTMPEAALIEIIERTNVADPKVVIPNDVRINGVSILAPEGPITVHEIGLSSRDVVQVTLTLYARRVIIGHEVEDV